MSAPVREELLSRFFGAHNDADREHYALFADLFADTGTGILPNRRGDEQVWYGFALDERGARVLRGMLLAVAGPSFSDWTGMAAHLDRQQPAEAALAAATRGPVCRLVPNRDDGQALVLSLKLLVTVIRQQPELHAFTVRPRHRVLADLELALLAGHGDEADTLIDELASTGAFSAVNILFLKLRRLDATGQHAELLEHPDLPDVLRRRRPRSISVAIARALRAEYVDPAVAQWTAGDRHAPERLGTEFSELDAAYAAVLSDELLATQEDLMPLIAIDRFLRGDTTQAESIAALVAEPSRGFLNALLHAKKTSAAPEPIGGGLPQDGEERSPAPLTSQPNAVQAEEATGVSALEFAVAAAEWATVLELASDATDSAALAHAVRAAYNLDTYSAATTAVELLEQADPDALASARADRLFRDTEHAVRAIAEPAEDDTERVPGSFLELFELVQLRGPVAQALEWAERGRYEWPHSDLQDPTFVRNLAASVENCASNDASHTSALGALAHLLDWIDRASGSEPPAEVFSAALDLVLYASDATSARDTLTIRLLESLLEARNDLEVLDARLNDILELWLRVAAPKRLDWPLTILDLALDYGGNAPTVGRFCSGVLNSCVPFGDRLDTAQTEALRSFAAELNLAEAATLFPREADPSGSADPLAALSGKVIGIYTLMQGAGTRARTILMQRCAGAEIQVNGDTVGTSRLRALAQRAHVMVVAYRSAQHAATDAIVAVRGRENIIPAQGRGSVALVRALEQWASDPQAVT